LPANNGAVNAAAPAAQFASIFASFDDTLFGKSIDGWAFEMPWYFGAQVES
jgi:hypothetical protein